jgi:hypothetical protein
MYAIVILVPAAVSAIAAVTAVLPSLGFDLRIIGRPNMPLEGMPAFRARQAWIALGIAVISLGVSAGAFYYFFRPRIVEKPVEKIIEKAVPTACPEQKAPEAKPIPGAKPLKKSEHVEANPATVPKVGTPSQNCPNGICVGGENSGTATVNNYAPPARHLSPDQVAGLEEVAKNFPAHVVVLAVPEHEPMDYAEEIRQTLLKFGKTEELNRGLSWAVIPKGLLVAINPKDDSAADAANLLQVKMTELGLAPARTVSANAKPSQVLIIVGVGP